MKIYHSLSVAGLASRSLKTPRNEIAKFLHSAIESGINEFDTADSYEAGDSERLLSLIRDSNLRITTKTGGFYFGASKSLNQIITNSKIYQKANIIRNRGYTDFNPNIKPGNLHNNLQKSLRRMDKNQVQNYLLHGYPPSELLEKYVHNLLMIKNQGLCIKIGISVDQIDRKFDFSWCDVVSLPLKGAEEMEKSFSGVLLINRVNPLELNFSRVKSVMAAHTVESINIKSTSLEHIKQNNEIIKIMNK